MARAHGQNRVRSSKLHEPSHSHWRLQTKRFTKDVVCICIIICTVYVYFEFRNVWIMSCAVADGLLSCFRPPADCECKYDDCVSKATQSREQKTFPGAKLITGSLEWAAPTGTTVYNLYDDIVKNC